MNINVGIDLHKTQFTVYEKNSKNEFEQYSTDDEGYGRFLKRVRNWKRRGSTVRIGVESTGNARYFKKRMEAEGAEVVVINTLKFKVVNESVKKTDKHDAATIAEFLEKDMLPEARICSEESEQVRRLLKVRTTLVRSIVTVKNQIHSLLTSIGFKDTKASLQSNRGRQKILDTLERAEIGLVVQPLFETIKQLEKSVKGIETEIGALMKNDRDVECLLSIPGCGKITAWTIRAYTDDIMRFASAKKYSAYAGLVPWVQNSNETVRYGRITKRGPEELRTAFVQLVMGMLRCNKTYTYRLMTRYLELKKNKGSGKSIVATARKLTKVVWCMLSAKEPFRVDLMLDSKLNEKALCMRRRASIEIA